MALLMLRPCEGSCAEATDVFFLGRRHPGEKAEVSRLRETLNRRRCNHGLRKRCRRRKNFGDGGRIYRCREGSVRLGKHPAWRVPVLRGFPIVPVVVTHSPFVRMQEELIGRAIEPWECGEHVGPQQHMRWWVARIIRGQHEVAVGISKCPVTSTGARQLRG